MRTLATIATLALLSGPANAASNQDSSELYEQEITRCNVMYDAKLDKAQAALDKVTKRLNVSRMGQKLGLLEAYERRSREHEALLASRSDCYTRAEQAYDRARKAEDASW